jgi:hypothetical protein
MRFDIVGGDNRSLQSKSRATNGGHAEQTTQDQPVKCAHEAYVTHKSGAAGLPADGMWNTAQNNRAIPLGFRIG